MQSDQQPILCMHDDDIGDDQSELVGVSKSRVAQNESGTSPKSGIAVLNETIFPVTVGLSMGGTHYWENDLGRKEIFYRQPGAVWYTVYCIPSTEETRLSSNKCAASIVKVAVPAVLGAAATIATGGILGPVVLETGAAVAGLEVLVAGASLGAVSVGSAATAIAVANSDPALSRPTDVVQNDFRLQEFCKACEGSKLFAQKRACFAGFSGTWLALRGGPYLHPADACWRPADFVLEEVGQEYVMAHGGLSSYSATRW